MFYYIAKDTKQFAQAYGVFNKAEGTGIGENKQKVSLGLRVIKFLYIF